MEHITLKNDFLLKKTIYIANKLEVYGMQWDHQVRPSISTK